MDRPPGWFDELRRFGAELDKIGTRYYGRDGKPITFAAWSVLFEDKSYQTLQVDRLPHPQGEVVISTVWLGMDHGFGSPIPIIFETMVFGPDHFPLTDLCERYATEEQANRGHLDVCQRVRSLIDVERGDN